MKLTFLLKSKEGIPNLKESKEKLEREKKKQKKKKKKNAGKNKFDVKNEINFSFKK